MATIFLLKAIDLKQVTMIELLVQIPGSIPQQTLNDALLLAIKSDQIKIIQILLNAGADPNTTDTRGTSALALMTSSRSGSGVKLLLEHGADVHDTAAFHTAARTGNTEAVELLLDHGAKVNCRDSTGSTALIVTARSCQSMETISRVLLDHGADVNAQDKEANTALHYAVTKLRGIQTLVHYGARSDLPNRDNNTPLMVAATEGLCSIIRVMMKHHCDVNVQNYAGKSPLHILAMKGHSCCLGEVLENGGDVNLRDKFGKTPLDDALEREQITTTRLLLQYNCDIIDDVTIMTELLISGCYDLVKILVIAGAKTHELRQLLLTSYNHNVDEAVVTWLRDVIDKPRTLLEMARFKIRSLLGAKDFKIKCDSLPLPKYLKDVLFMMDLNHY